MELLNINIYIFFYITILFCFSEHKNYKKKYNNFINYNKRFRRNILFQNYQDKFSKNISFYHKEGKRSIYHFDNEKNARKKRMVKSIFKEKWELPIPYYVDHGVDTKIIDLSLSIIQKKTCVKFVKFLTMPFGLSGIRYYKGDGCSSRIGKKEGRVWQNISIGVGCEYIQIIQHETMHALGIHHAISRYDRDKYLSLIKQNIKPDYLGEFKKVSLKHSRTFGVPVDFGSIMMYRVDHFSRPEKLVALPHDKLYMKTMGNQENMAFTDAMLINKYYCKNVCPKKITCMNGGYQDPNNCDNCKCIKGFTGRWCQLVSPPLTNCEKSLIIVKDEITLFEQQGRKKCLYHVFCKKNKNVAIYIVKSGFFPNKGIKCKTNNSLEVKYWNDKRPVGARFCKVDKNILILTENNHGMIYFRSTFLYNYVTILLKSVVYGYKKEILKNEFIKEKIKMNL
uniref:Metalloendopeptidase n=2 Tax=Strongyloides stercoralis TaxID=6248 RepID=A0A0K0EJJ9_STRER